jgi:beta-galactosidase
LINGIVMPDRRPNPSAWEVKKVYQPVDIELVDPEGPVVAIRNDYDFANLNDLKLVWSLIADGVVQQTGDLDVPTVAPGELWRVRIPYSPFQPVAGTEYYLNLSFQTLTATELVPAGHELAFGQFRLPFFQTLPAQTAESLPPLHVDDAEATATVSGANFTITFDKQVGVLTSFIYKGTEFILSGPEPNFWRAPTDNDFGGRWQTRLAVWRDAGADRTVRRVIVAQPSPQRVTIRTRVWLESVRADYSTLYTILGNGEVTIENHFEPRGEGLPRMPRFGMQMTIPRQFSHLQWYGRGPHESYWDRKTGAAVGLYSGTVSEQFHPYVRPQENGNKTDVRWFALADESGTGLLVIGMPLLSMSALHFTVEDLDPGESKARRHSGELVERALVNINIDYKQMGVGGITSWGPTGLPKYSLYYQDYRYSFRLRPFSLEDGSPAELAKVRYE